MTRALVLGGGGAVGVAWEAVMVAGLIDAGVDLNAADLVVRGAGAVRAGDDRRAALHRRQRALVDVGGLDAAREAGPRTDHRARWCAGAARRARAGGEAGRGRDEAARGGRCECAARDIRR